MTERGGSQVLGAESIRETHVIVTDKIVSLEWIARHQRTPKINQEHPKHPGFWVSNCDPTQKGPRHWELSVISTVWQPTEIPDNPLDEPADISIDAELIEEPTFFDYKKRPMVTTAGELIPGLTVVRTAFVYRVAKKLGADPVWMDTYGGALNSDAVRIRGRLREPKTLMLRRLSLGPYTKKNKISYTDCQFELHWRQEGWIQRVWNKGTLQLVEFKTASGAKAYRQERILSGNPAQPIEEPTWLTQAGKVVENVLNPSGDIPVDPAKLVILSFQTQVDLPFNGVLPLS